ncbi:MAG: cell wall hydrolase [Clostridia bacterium]|nr:cell wall hydrolase [Clostridia bacterium]
MKKRNFVRNLVVAGVAVALSGCGKQEYNVTIPIENPHDNITYEVKTIQKSYYTPSDEERQFAYLMACAQAHGEESIIQTMVTNVAINRAERDEKNLIDVFTEKNQFSGIHDGVPSIMEKNEDGTATWVPVTEDMLTDELKKAVDLAFEQDFTEGAMHYYKIYSNSKDCMPKEFIQEGDWIFFKEF